MISICSPYLQDKRIFRVVSYSLLIILVEIWSRRLSCLCSPYLMINLRYYYIPYQIYQYMNHLQPSFHTRRLTQQYVSLSLSYPYPCSSPLTFLCLSPTLSISLSFWKFCLTTNPASFLNWETSYPVNSTAISQLNNQGYMRRRLSGNLLLLCLALCLCFSHLPQSLVNHHSINLIRKPNGSGRVFSNCYFFCCTFPSTLFSRNHSQKNLKLLSKVLLDFFLLFFFNHFCLIVWLFVNCDWFTRILFESVFWCFVLVVE